jgi:hypothetical protein
MGMFCKGWSKVAIQASVAALLCAVGGLAQAQITRSFLAPHEYSLPDPKGMKTWDVFVQYTTLQNTDDVWDNNSNSTSLSSAAKSQTLVGLSKWVHFWTPELLGGNIGLAWETIPVEVSVRSQSGSSSGFGDPVEGPAVWIKPAPNWTLGWDNFVQIPWGTNGISGHTWNYITALWWDGQWGKLNYTANLGTTWFGAAPGGARAGQTVYSNNRFGYHVTDLLEPYAGIDYQTQATSSGGLSPAPSNHELAYAVGIMVYTLPKSSIALHYSGGISGENTGKSNNLNVRFVWVF